MPEVFQASLLEPQGTRRTQRERGQVKLLCVLRDLCGSISSRRCEKKRRGAETTEGAVERERPQRKNLSSTLI
jgi:hypothetical protein